MSQLFTLLYGKSKKRMYPIMTDVKRKCENYRDARQNVRGWHDIVPAQPDATVWRQKSATVGGNRVTTVGRVGKGSGISGYIDERGFNPHT
jgi:hypothetical protein